MPVTLVEREEKQDKILEKLDYNQQKMKEKLHKHYELLKWSCLILESKISTYSLTYLCNLIFEHYFPWFFDPKLYKRYFLSQKTL